METILTVCLIVVAYGFGFFSGSICMAEKNADIHNEERKKAFDFAFKNYINK
tara:strand:+ start:114 stop:269 length:156 start_codon:yes stop_codon:yes gene_type:complete